MLTKLLTMMLKSPVTKITALGEQFLWYLLTRLTRYNESDCEYCCVSYTHTDTIGCSSQTCGR